MGTKTHAIPKKKKGNKKAARKKSVKIKKQIP